MPAKHLPALHRHGPKGQTDAKIYVFWGRNVPSGILQKYHFSTLFPPCYKLLKAAGCCWLAASCCTAAAALTAAACRLLLLQAPSPAGVLVLLLQLWWCCCCYNSSAAAATTAAAAAAASGCWLPTAAYWLLLPLAAGDWLCAVLPYRIEVVLVRNQGQMYYSLARSPLRLPGSADISQ